MLQNSEQETYPLKSFCCGKVRQMSRSSSLSILGAACFCLKFSGISQGLSSDLLLFHVEALSSGAEFNSLKFKTASSGRKALLMDGLFQSRQQQACMKATTLSNLHQWPRRGKKEENEHWLLSIYKLINHIPDSGNWIRPLADDRASLNRFWSLPLFLWIIRVPDYHALALHIFAISAFYLK